MSVYVGVPMWPYGRMIMCHMIADTEDELDEMATKLGLRRWKQESDRDRGIAALVHYDVAKSKRSEAITYGAIALDTLEEEAAVLERLAKEQGLI